MEGVFAEGSKQVRVAASSGSGSGSGGGGQTPAEAVQHPEKEKGLSPAYLPAPANSGGSLCVAPMEIKTQAPQPGNSPANPRAKAKGIEN
jgi:hypothetical protein